MKPKLPWVKHADLGGFVFKTPIITDRGKGDYEIWLQRRPVYCDRGDWLIFVECHGGDLDAQDGFPRYFFGTEDEVKVQMETWLSRRKAYRDYLLR